MGGKDFAFGVRTEVDQLISHLDRLESTNPGRIGGGNSAAFQPGPLGYGLHAAAIHGSPFSDFWIQPFPLPSGSDEMPPDTDSASLLARLFGAWRADEPGNEILKAPVRLWGPVADEILPAFAQARRLYRMYDDGRQIDLESPIDCDSHPSPWNFFLQVESASFGESFRFYGVLARDQNAEERIALPGETDIHFSRDGWMLHRQTLSRIDVAHATWLSVLHKNGWQITVPRAQLLDFFRRAGVRKTLPPLLDADQLPWRIFQNPVPVPVLETRSTPLYCVGRLLFDYDGHRVPAFDPNKLKEVRDACGHLIGYVVRQPAAEQERVRELDFLGFMGSADLDRWTIDGTRSADAFAALIENDWRIEVAANDGTQFLPVCNPDWNLVGNSGIDWFDLRGVSWGELSEGVSANVAALLRCIRNKSSFIQMPGKGAFLITGEMRRFLEAAQNAGRQVDGKIQIAPGLAGVMLAMGNVGVSGAADPESSAARLRAQAAANLKDFDGIRPAAPQDTFTGTLRDYQKAGLGWLRFLRQSGLGGCLADDMGLGKTVQVIALLDEHHAATNGARLPSMVVAPLSLLGNWLDELRKFAPRLRVHVHHGSERFPSARHFGGFDVILTTYGLVHSDSAWLSQTPFEYIVLDEAHQIRNPQAKASAAVKKLNGQHRLALTGTPIINYVRDLKSLFDFLSPGLLHAIPDLNELMKNGGPLNEAEARKIGNLLRPFILRRTKSEVLKDLPAKTESMLYCELSPEERETYNGLRDACRRQLLQDIDAYGIDRQRMHVLTALMRLRQLACHPGMLDPSRQAQGGAKLDLLLDELEQVLEEGHKLLVFSNFVSFLHIIRSRLHANGMADQILYLDGSTPDRGELVRQFQNDPGKRIFLISIKAGGLGLNLTAADYVYIADPWWNSAIETQAIDRTHRIGQANPVFAYRLVARDTIEEKMLQLQETKRGLVDLILDEQNANPASLTRADVEFLLS